MNGDNSTEKVARCYACGRAMKGRTLEVYLEDDGHREVPIGTDCYRHVHAAGAAGYKPPRGGPRLFVTADLARTYAANLAAYHGDCDGDFNYW